MMNQRSQRPPLQGKRWIRANLDCEEEFAGLEQPRNHRRAGLSQQAMLTLSAAGTLLRAFAGPGDLLWTPLPVPPERIPRVPFLPEIQLISGPVPPELQSRECLPWGAFKETPTGERPRTTQDAQPALHQSLWSLKTASPEVAALVNHRRFHFETSRALEVLLPGSRWITEPRQLEESIHGDGLHGISDRWVTKVPFSAAGRSFVIANRGDPIALKRAMTLLEKHGALLFEPWVDRTLDLGCLGTVNESGVTVLGIHQLVVDAAGKFRGISILSNQEARKWGVTPEEESTLTETCDSVGIHLSRRGYTGPFGVDSYRYRTRKGEFLQPLGEVNGRLSFGFVARGLMERYAPDSTEVAVHLRFGKPPVSDRRQGKTIPLLLPTPEHEYGAWMEVQN